MKAKHSFLVGAVVIFMMLLYVGLYQGGYTGITEDKINDEQMKTVSWDPQDYRILGESAEGGSLYAGVIFMEDFSKASYFLYINKSGLPFGWRFLQSGSLADGNGLLELDCGRYGGAYITLNAEYAIQRIELEEGSVPPSLENTRPIVQLKTGTTRFYDKNGDLVEPSVVKVVD